MEEEFLKGFVAGGLAVTGLTYLVSDFRNSLYISSVPYQAYLDSMSEKTGDKGAWVMNRKAWYRFEITHINSKERARAQYILEKMPARGPFSWHAKKKAMKKLHQAEKENEYGIKLPPHMKEMEKEFECPLEDQIEFEPMSPEDVESFKKGRKTGSASVKRPRARFVPRKENSV